jgi:hypothetical protein
VLFPVPGFSSAKIFAPANFSGAEQGEGMGGLWGKGWGGFLPAVFAARNFSSANFCRAKFLLVGAIGPEGAEHHSDCGVSVVFIRERQAGSIESM